MTAIRMLFSWLTEKGVLAMNPAREVKTERFSRTEGKTPAFVEGEVQSETRILSRNQKDFGGKFPEVKDSIAALDVQDAIIDGEIVAL
jgi:site-specific recombinase XerC